MAKGVLRKLEEGEITKWLSGASFVVKPSGGMRLVTDLVHLNRAVKRPTHPLAPVNDILSSLDARAKFFVTLDLVGGYWQIALGKKSQQLVAFLTEWGGYTYLRAPMGLTSSGDIFCARTDEALAGIPGLHKLVDDILICGETKEELMDRIVMVLDRCRANHITLSEPKARVGTEVKFAGFIVSHNGIKADPAKIEALKNFPAPKDLTNLKSYLGLANQLGEFCPDM